MIVVKSLLKWWVGTYPKKKFLIVENLAKRPWWCIVREFSIHNVVGWGSCYSAECVVQSDFLLAIKKITGALNQLMSMLSLCKIVYIFQERQTVILISLLLGDMSLQ